MVDQDASFYLMVVVAMSDHEIHETAAQKTRVLFPHGLVRRVSVVRPASHLDDDGAEVVGRNDFNYDYFMQPEEVEGEPRAKAKTKGKAKAKPKALVVRQQTMRATIWVFCVGVLCFFRVTISVSAPDVCDSWSFR